jgi:hypothetical protein
VSFLKLVIGFTGRRLTKALRDNIHLTASFLFTVTCSPCFIVEETGKLIHEMMALTWMLKSYPIHSTPLSQFVRTVAGYGDILDGELPYELFSNLGRAATERLPVQMRCPVSLRRYQLRNLPKSFTKSSKSYKIWTTDALPWKGAAQVYSWPLYFCGCAQWRPICRLMTFESFQRLELLRYAFPSIWFDISMAMLPNGAFIRGIRRKTSRIWSSKWTT